MTIQNNAYGLNSNLPKLLHAYDLAKKHDLVTDPIRPDALKAMEYSIQHIKTEVSHSNTIIDMLLMNLRKTELNTDDFVYLSMANTIQEALDRYPFDSQKSKQVVKADLNDDFAFFGSDLLM
ncbi:hypothetical protein ACTVFP_23760, partial [Escherichia coli]|uniref:hypothetical protein n=1 Tax=Escherichia coli TaxID=562 RepID=UPI003FA5C4B7